ncbi:MAG TPA: immune inhibitor A [Kiritimatiellia bacterium]|nr:immune inhibitor A [Kiritimatiellia bacterium]HRZ13280.1 immune inhibitor A [Kiritimatiellia bacterium]HSA18729.1 immune inhibitor A [Kiritimatiellia bacterium]
MKRLAVVAAAGISLALSSLQAPAVMPRDDDGGSGKVAPEDRDHPNPAEVRRIRERIRLQQELRQRQEQPARRRSTAREAELQADIDRLRLAEDDRVLVILVEFAGSNTFSWTAGTSTWDPLGRCERTEYDGVNFGNTNASAFFAAKYGYSGVSNFTYVGPLHNEIPRPRSADDESGEGIWTEDFSPAFFSNIIFGAGWNFSYLRDDGSPVNADFTGKSVRDYYLDFSGGAYEIVGEVVGWVQVTNSTWWYGADAVPGRRSGANSAASNGGVPGTGNARQLVIDALEAVKAAYPAFDWAKFDTDSDGVINRLWIIHAGHGEEDSQILLNRTSYGEGALWSHSWSLSAPYEIVPGVSAYSYIMMPENSGIGVLAHEYAHNLGAIDLYTYGDGDTSAGFWTLMADDWVGFPLGFQPPAMDPLHLDQWGWLNPLVINDPSQEYTVTLGQPSDFPGGAEVYRAVKIELPDMVEPLPVAPIGQFQWWGGDEYDASSLMIQSAPLAIPAGGASLVYDTAYDTEAGYDFFRIYVSTNGRVSWTEIAAYDGTSAGYPAYRTLTNNLAAYANRSINLAFQYWTDSSVLGSGVFLDEVRVVSGVSTLLYDNAESDSGYWQYTAPWTRTGNTKSTPHDYYLQWRNTSGSGGYDSGLGSTNWRFGPVGSGLLVWYHNTRYADNEIADYLTEGPSFGPKGNMLVVDAHPAPYHDPWWLAQGYTGEQANISGRGLMRDAPFSLSDTPAFWIEPPFIQVATGFAGRAAVSLFSDALGYYPGLEKAAMAGDTSRWFTVQWDSSTVIPCASPYGVKAAGYPGNSNFWHIVQDRVTLGTNVFQQYATNLVVDGTAAGGTGNPGALAPVYGWNVRLLSESGTQATVRIWNGSPVEAMTLRPAGSGALAVSCEPVAGRVLSLQASSNLLPGGAEFLTVTNFNTSSNVVVNMDGPRRAYRIGIE